MVADSGEFYRSSEIQLDGEHAPAAQRHPVPSIPAGDYEAGRSGGADGGMRGVVWLALTLVGSGARE